MLFFKVYLVIIVVFLEDWLNIAYDWIEFVDKIANINLVSKKYFLFAKNLCPVFYYDHNHDQLIKVTKSQNHSMIMKRQTENHHKHGKKK